jgi:hypothetical protein
MLSGSSDYHSYQPIKTGLHKVIMGFCIYLIKYFMYVVKIQYRLGPQKVADHLQFSALLFHKKIGFV